MRHVHGSVRLDLELRSSATRREEQCELRKNMEITIGKPTLSSPTTPCCTAWRHRTRYAIPLAAFASVGAGTTCTAWNGDKRKQCGKMIGTTGHHWCAFHGVQLRRHNALVDEVNSMAKAAMFETSTKCPNLLRTTLRDASIGDAFGDDGPPRPKPEPGAGPGLAWPGRTCRAISASGPVLFLRVQAVARRRPEEFS